MHCPPLRASIRCLQQSIFALDPRFVNVPSRKDPMDEAEWPTRKKRVDTQLRSLSPQWQIIRYREGLDLSSLHRVAVEEGPTPNAPADYALFVNGQLLGIIEAKKVPVNPQNVLEQAKRYAQGEFQGPGNWDGFRVPLLDATNGEII